MFKICAIFSSFSTPKSPNPIYSWENHRTKWWIFSPTMFDDRRVQLQRWSLVFIHLRCYSIMSVGYCTATMFFGWNLIEKAKLESLDYKYIYIYMYCNDIDIDIDIHIFKLYYIIFYAYIISDHIILDYIRLDHIISYHFILLYIYW